MPLNLANVESLWVLQHEGEDAPIARNGLAAGLSGHPTWSKALLLFTTEEKAAYAAKAYAEGEFDGRVPNVREMSLRDLVEALYAARKLGIELVAIDPLARFGNAFGEGEDLTAFAGRALRRSLGVIDTE